MNEIIKLMDKFFDAKYETDLFNDEIAEEKLSFEIINEIYLPLLEDLFPNIPQVLGMSLDKAIKYCWGEKAFYEVSETSIIFKHTDGREIDFFLLF